MGDSKRQKTEVESRDSKRQKTEIERGVSKVEKIEKVEKEESGSVNFEELRDDLFREAGKLVCAVPSTKIAVWCTSPTESDVAMYSFGYPTVNSVVKAFLKDSCPVPVPEDADIEDEDAAEDEDGSCQEFWWEDKKLLESTNLEELDDACDRLERLRDHMILELEARSRAEVSSGNHNDKAQPKP